MASDSSESPMILTPESTGTSGPNADTFPDSPTTTTSVTAAKKARRQTAFYPNMNSSNKPMKPFSRSAAKRESVMALGSIEHLQHYFTKTGLAAKKTPLALANKPHHGLVLAIGGMAHLPTSPSLSDIQDIPAFQMPPSPAMPVPPQQTFPPHVKIYEVDPESLLPGVIEDVIAVAQAWKVQNYRDELSTPNLDTPFDVLEVLKTTTRAIKSIRNYLLSLPDESAGTIRAHFRPRNLGPGKSSSSSSSASTSSSSSSPPKQTQPDPIILIRRSALEVLTVLRQLEENWRLPLDDDAYDAQSDGGHSHGDPSVSSPSNGTLDLPPDGPHHRPGHRPDHDPDSSITFSLVQVQGRYESIPVWEDEEGTFRIDEEEEKEKKDEWDERLVLGTGWLYRQDVKLSDLGKERDVVDAYLDIVDEVLFEGKRVAGGERGWDKVRQKREGRASSRAAKIRRVSSGEGRTLGAVEAEAAKRRASTGVVNVMMRGMSLSEEPEEMDDIQEEDEELTIDDDDLPSWAKRLTFIDDRLGRVHAVLAFFLPLHLQSALGVPSSKADLLSSLSSGQLLCIAYNSCVRKSKKPWGFVAKDGVHDIIALEKAAKEAGEEKEGKKLWTFRRTDNLRLWVGALKLRYMIPIQVPNQPLSQHPGSSSVTNTPLSSPAATAQRFALSKADREPPIQFDARIVAKKEEGWEDMLGAVLYRWVDKVVDERRSFQ